MATSAQRAVALFGKHARDRALWRSMAALGVAAERERLVPHRYFWELYPDASELEVPLGMLQFRPSNMDPYEVYCLSALALMRMPQTVFEFGTFDGATTLRMAALLPDSQIVTIDLPDEQSEVTARSTGASPGSGYLFRDTPQAAQIKQLYGDSRVFDFSPWYGRAGMIIVDAGHAYDCVKADTASALRMVAPDGIVVWDDYCPLWPDVV